MTGTDEHESSQTGDGAYTALIIHPEIKSRTGKNNVSALSGMYFQPSLEEQLHEAAGLAHAISLEVIETFVARVDRPNSGYLFGSGFRKDIADFCAENKPAVAIVNHTLSPVQQRNLEKEWQVKVIDRTGLILEIFGERAQTREGRIQVDLAALEYQKSRLVRSWTHLERQRGGAGFMGGPGETQIEIDRRIIGDKITRLKKELEQVRKNRDLQRRSRERVPFPIIALVGYTNAGKSTLFNTLTGASVYAEDLPFATLDPTMRKVTLANGTNVIFADTVGFIADLPTHLVAAFRATLEQVSYADIILHVRDIARPDHEAQKQDVIDILHDLGVEYDTDSRIIEVWNKADAIPEDEQGDILRRAKFSDTTVLISALTGQGLDELLRAVQEKLSEARQNVSFDIKIADGQALAWLYKHAHVTGRDDSEEFIHLEMDIDPADLGRFCERFTYQPVPVRSANERQHKEKQGHGG